MDQLIDDVIKFSLRLSVTSSLTTSFAFRFNQVNELDGCLFDSKTAIFPYLCLTSTQSDWRGATVRLHQSRRPQKKIRKKRENLCSEFLFKQCFAIHPTVVSDGVLMKSLAPNALIERSFEGKRTRKKEMRSFIHDCQCVMMIPKHFARYNNKSQDKHSVSQWNAQVNTKSRFMINRFSYSQGC